MKIVAAVVTGLRSETAPDLDNRTLGFALPAEQTRLVVEIAGDGGTDIEIPKNGLKTASFRRARHKTD